jgi:hypothetical protein
MPTSSVMTKASTNDLSMKIFDWKQRDETKKNPNLPDGEKQSRAFTRGVIVTCLLSLISPNSSPPSLRLTLFDSRPALLKICLSSTLSSSRHLSSLISHLSFLISSLFFTSLIHHLPSLISHLSSLISSLISHLSSPISHLPHLPSLINRPTSCSFYPYREHLISPPSSLSLPSLAVSLSPNNILTLISSSQTTY